MPLLVPAVTLIVTLLVPAVALVHYCTSSVTTHPSSDTTSNTNANL